MRHTKIIATLGPATDTDRGIAELIAAGVDLFRLNFSHGDHASHGRTLQRIRAATAASGRAIAVMQDLSGPKIRTGRLRDGQPMRLEPGATLTIALGDFVGDAGRVSTTYADLPRVVRAGDPLLLDDGRIQLRVESTTADTIVARVIDGGTLGEHKGINVPGVALPAVGLTPKDVDDLKFGVSLGVDMVALSFVQRPEDLRMARDVATAAGAPDVPLIAKLERPEALDRLDAVLHAADAVMVARGDLGLEIPLEHVPQVQKLITRRARALGLPVILATQVLESMRDEPRPTRAEVTDAATAVDHGVDAIMLAGETAIGKYPARAVTTLDAIIRDAEHSPALSVVPLEETRMVAGHGRALCEAAVTLAERGDATAIVAITRRGHTAQLLSSLRPRAAIFAVTETPDVARRLALSRGVVPLVGNFAADVAGTAARVGALLVARGAVAAGSAVVVVGISPELGQGRSNFLTLQRCLPAPADAPASRD